MACSATLVAAEDLTLGPAMVSIDLGEFGDYKVGSVGSFNDFHKSSKGKFGYTIFQTVVFNQENKVMLELHLLDEPIDVTPELLEHCINESDRVPLMVLCRLSPSQLMAIPV
ncbi:MAG: hypothetical protein MUO26_08260 [Methanotrichaceae archaeon]|nr:hypothetical protein [Methanotrichaceae archaeon]